MTRSTSTFSGVGGTTIEYDVYEPEGEPKGLVLVAHGLGEHRGRYEHVADRLTALGLRVAVPDHRGHGKSGGPRCDTRDVSDYTADLETLRRLDRWSRARRRTCSATAWAGSSRSTTRWTTRPTWPR